VLKTCKVKKKKEGGGGVSHTLKKKIDEKM
jgi:hypothetical protein